MLLPLYYSTSPFFIKTLDSSSTSNNPIQSHRPNPRSPKSFICCCSTTENAEIASKSAIQRIAEKLRSLGYIEEGNSKKTQHQETTSHGSAGEIFLPSSEKLPKQRVGYTIDSSWGTPENRDVGPGPGTAVIKFRYVRSEEERKKEKVPTLAELALSGEELRRLRSIGIGLKKKLKVGKAGITEGIVNGIHERWRQSELVKITCEDLCRLNMKRTHDILERKTGGLVVWRSGGIIILYRGASYKYPYFLTDKISSDTAHDESESSMGGVDSKNEGNLLPIDGVNSSSLSPSKRIASTSLIHGVGSPNRVRFQLPGEAELAEEADRLLDGLGPRFTEWWGYEPLPIDADLLPAIVPGYRRPFRLLPYGIKPKLTDGEMTTLRRLSRSLPCHFALGRNRNLQGLASSMIKLWEKCEVAIIAVKRGVEDTNSVLMVEEIKRLTGGTLISRDSEFFAFYRGKDFLPPAVSTAIEERRKPRVHGKEHIAYESPSVRKSPQLELQTSGPASADQLSQAYDQNERNPATEESILNPANSAVESISNKLSMALEKKGKAEKLLAHLEKEVEVHNPEGSSEGLTEEERHMLKKVGLRMGPFLLLGRRGVFAGTVENMHLHWKYRELVKIISSARCIEDALGAAQTLEAESGGVLVAVERVNKGYAIIMYRGKNYQRPTNLRPQTLLNKRQATKRSLEAQRAESLKLHVLKLGENVDQLKHQLAKEDVEINHEESSECSQTVREPESGVQLTKTYFSYNQLKSGAVESSSCQEVLEGCGSDSAMHSDNNVDATPLDKLMTFSSQHSISTEAQSESSSELVRGESHTNRFHSDVGNTAHDDFQSSFENSLSQSGRSPVMDNAEVHVSDHESEGSTILLDKHELDSVHREKVDKASHEVPFPSKTTETRYHFDTVNYSHNQLEAGFVESTNSQPALGSCGSGSTYDEEAIHLDKLMSSSQFKKSAKKAPPRVDLISNRDRLILRKQALKMKKRPVLAVGRSNDVTGVAKTIKTHFQKNPLAIVSVKGRAKGTSIQELVSKLEEATDSVMVSQEPTKVILYRGWGEEDGPRGVKNKRNENSGGRVGGARDMVSPELMAAIRLECGLSSSEE